jgi:glycosyltransferase involved in cell wall biosynthesis
LKVVLISHEFPPFFFGGVGAHCYNLAYNLAKTGTHVTVLAGGSKEIEIKKMNNRLEVIRLPYFDFPSRPFWFQIRNFQVFSKLLNNYDVIHVVDAQSGVLPIYIAKKLKKPVVTSIHSVPPIFTLKNLVYCPLGDISMGDIGLDFFENPLRTFATKFCLLNSSHVIFCGLYALEKAKTYLGIGIQKPTVIYNGISFGEIKHYLSSYDDNIAEGAKIVFMGRLFYFKGLVHLMRALALLKKDLKQFSVEIFGEGPLQNKIAKLASSLGLNNEVHLRGFLNDRSKLLKEIMEAKVVVLPSLHEVGPSIAALEAMACKKPVLAFDRPFTREFIVSMQNGLLAKPYDVDDFAKKLYLLLTDTELCAKLGQNAHEYVKENHNWSTLIKEYIKIYNMVSS